MQKKRIIILGGGISGLSLAYFLSKCGHFEIDLIEKSDRLGGSIDSDTTTGFFFEKGPRIFRGSRCETLLSLIKEIGLEKEIIETPTHAKYIWIDGKLRKAPALSWGLIKGILREWRVEPSFEEDESVWDFACRRFNRTVAEHFFDPLVVGTYAGGVREASIKSCFPRFKKWEEEYGSVIKGAFKTPRFSGPRMFTLKRGMKSIVQKLEEITPIHFHYQEEVIDIKNGVEVKTSRGIYEADFVFSALPCHVIGRLLIPQLLNISHKGTTIVNLGYHQKVLKKEGFGYLVASKEEEDVLGVVFESSSFPQFNQTPQESRLTVMLKDENLSDREGRELAMKALKKHLKIDLQPAVSMVVRAHNVFPQMKVGHEKMIRTIEETIKQKYPRLQLVGNYLYGVGVNDCIERARSVAENFLRVVAS